jgi:hypothetical protein
MTIRMPRHRYVPQWEIDEEQAELRSLQDRRNYVNTEIVSIQTEVYASLWIENVRLAARVRYWRRRVTHFQDRLEYLKYTVYLRPRGPRWQEYANIYNYLLPQAQRNLHEYQEAQEKVIAELWRITAELTPLHSEIASLEISIRHVQEALRRKVRTELKRVELNFYIIIAGGTKTYRIRRKSEAQAKKHGRYVTVTRKYPRGRFQAWIELDCWVITDIDNILWETDPAHAMIPFIIQEVNDELVDLFHVLPFGREMFTIGETSTILGDEDIGKPPKKIKVERTVEKPETDESPSEPWETKPQTPIMSQKQYNSLVAGMTDYVAELKKRGKWQESLG